MAKGLRTILAAACCATALSGQAAIVNVDFDSLPGGNNPNPLTVSGASFTTPGGFNFIVGILGDVVLCASTSATSVLDCSLNLEVSFASGVSNISFGFMANNVVTVGSDIGDVSVFSGSTQLGTVDLLVSDSNNLSLDSVSLAAFSGVTRFVVSTTDFGGLAYGNFRYDTAPSGTVPEPVTLSIVALAMLGVVASSRRRSWPRASEL